MKNQCKKPKNQGKLPLSTSDADNVRKGPTCHLLTNVRAGSILRGFWEQPVMTSEWFWCCHSFFSCCSHLATSYLFIHPYVKRWNIDLKGFWGGERRSDLCICEASAKNVLVLALAKKLSIFWKTKALLAFFFFWLFITIFIALQIFWL